MEKEEEGLDWACPACGGYGLAGHCVDSIWVDYDCPVCGGSGVKVGVTPPWEGEEV